MRTGPRATVATGEPVGPAARLGPCHPPEASDAAAPIEMIGRQLGGAAFGAFVVLTYVWDLGGGSLRDWDEALTGERAREMLVTGDWLTPQFGSEPDLNKPPLYYWLTIATMTIVGVNELAVRSWSVLFALGCLAWCYGLGRALGHHPASGLLAAGWLASNPLWVNKTREGLLDSGLMFGVLGAAYFLLGRPHTRRTGTWAGVLGAVGCLVKGPLVLVAFLLPAWEFGVVRRQPGWRRTVGLALAVLAAVALPWFVAQAVRWGPEALWTVARYNLVERVLTPVETHVGSHLYYVKKWAESGTLSLAGFVGLLGYFAVVDRRALRRHSTFAALALVTLLALSLAASKRREYLLLVLPPAAIATGGLSYEFLATRLSVRARRVAVVGLATLALLLFARHYHAHPDYSRGKAIGLSIRAVSRPDAVILTAGPPVNSILFYSERRVLAVDGGSLDAAVDRHGEGPDAQLFLVLAREGGPATRGRLERTGKRPRRFHVLHQDKKWIVLAAEFPPE